jgi:hypothetical protein
MSHECDQCGMYCVCDGEDMHNPQPPTCVHFYAWHCDADDDSADGDGARSCSTMTACGWTRVSLRAKTVRNAPKPNPGRCGPRNRPRMMRATDHERSGGP